MDAINRRKQMVCMILALLLALCVTAGLLFETRTKQVQQNLAEEVFRFHVLANSDSEKDQRQKLVVKERVISYMKAELPDAKSVEETKRWAGLHLDEIEAVAEEVLRAEDCEHSVRVEVTNCYFPDKTYGDVTFPKGYYDALRIEIGEAEGQNWWCVLYPNLCFVDATHAVVSRKGKQELKAVLDEDAYEMVTATSKFKIKWFFFR